MTDEEATLLQARVMAHEYLLLQLFHQMAAKSADPIGGIERLAEDTRERLEKSGIR